MESEKIVELMARKVEKIFPKHVLEAYWWSALSSSEEDVSEKKWCGQSENLCAERQSVGNQM